jgi:hypothetical protein
MTAAQPAARAAVLSMAAKGHTVNEICTALEIRECSVRKWIAAAGATYGSAVKEWSPEDKSNAMRIAMKISAAEASRQTGVPAQTIGMWLRAAGLTGKARKSEKAASYARQLEREAMREPKDEDDEPRVKPTDASQSMKWHGKAFRLVIDQRDRKYYLCRTGAIPAGCLQVSKLPESMLGKNAYHEQWLVVNARGFPLHPSYIHHVAAHYQNDVAASRDVRHGNGRKHMRDCGLMRHDDCHELIELVAAMVARDLHRKARGEM